MRVGRRAESCVKSSAGGKRRLRAAASSIARGNPSRRTQISATAAALSPARAKSGTTAWLRPTKRATASKPSNASSGGSGLREGSVRGGTPSSCSARRCNGSRLVASTLRRGAPSSSSATSGAASSTCSRLSSTSSSSRPARCSASTTRSGRSPVSRRPSAAAMAGIKPAGSGTVARGTKKTPSAKSSTNSAATCSPRRVLPIPPGPVRVRRRTWGRQSRSRTAATSRSRPTRGVA